jgi:hypothetical protein
MWCLFLFSNFLLVFCRLLMIILMSSPSFDFSAFLILDSWFSHDLNLMTSNVYFFFWFSKHRLSSVYLELARFLVYLSRIAILILPFFRALFVVWCTARPWRQWWNTLPHVPFWPTAHVCCLSRIYCPLGHVLPKMYPSLLLSIKFKDTQQDLGTFHLSHVSHFVRPSLFVVS